MALTSFIESKRRSGLKSAGFYKQADEDALQDGRQDDAFSESAVQQQYNHLLSCLEHTTVCGDCCAGVFIGLMSKAV